MPSSGGGTAKGEDAVIDSVLVYIAMSAEATPSVEQLGLKPRTDVLPEGEPWSLHMGHTEAGTTVSILTAGKDSAGQVDNVGTVPAAVAVYAAAHALRPSLIVNAGTAGGFKAKGAAIGDVFVVSSAANHDRRIPLPGFDKYGVGQLALRSGSIAAALGLKEGALSTGNSLDMTERDRECLLANEAHVKDMEGAAVAWVGQTLGIPVVAIKAVTDIVDGDRPTTEEFLEHLASAAAALKRTLPLLLEHVGGKKVSEL